MRRTRVSVTAGLLLTAGLAVPVSASSSTAAATCQGQEATSVGTPGRPLTGTAGPDVVVTNGASRVSTSGGDDVVCVTRGNARVSTGAGDDSVVAQLTGAPAEGRFVSTDLGAGEDTYRGWAGRDSVYGAAPGVPDTDTDVVRTLGGDDFVVAGEAGAVFTDTVDLGPGPGTVLVYGPSAAPSAVLRGGGRGTLGLGGDDGPSSYTGTWTIDNRAGTASQDGVQRFAFTGFTTFPEVGERMRFLGTDADEEVRSGVRLVADLGGGDDRVTLSEHVEERQDGDLNGSVVRAGGGTDVLRLEARGLFGSEDPRDGAVYLNLPQGTARLDGQNDVRFAGVETTSVRTTDVARVVGTARADRVHVSACDLVLDGFGGADVVSVFEDFYDSDEYSCEFPLTRLVRTGAGDDTVTLDARAGEVWAGPGDDRVRAGTLGEYDDLFASGGGGDDVLRGYLGPDRLFGGTGRDVTVGGQGRDLCRGETRRSCER